MACRVTAAIIVLGVLAAGSLPPAAAKAPLRTRDARSASPDFLATAASHRTKPPRKRRQKQIGDAPCAGDPADVPTIDFDLFRRHFPKLEFELGVPFHLCLTGFADDEPIQIAVTLPNASQRSMSIQPDPSFLAQTWYFVTYPPDPLGSYDVRATQGSRTAAATFEVVAPPQPPRFETLLFTMGAGRKMPFVLAGFDPGERVSLYLYRRTGYNTRTFEATYSRGRRRVAAVRADRQGFARGSVIVRRAGDYFLSAGGLFSSYAFTVVPAAA